MKRNKEQKNKDNMVLCKCGCGQRIHAFDKLGRARVFIFGHQRRNAKCSEETRQKMSKNNKGMKGKTHSKETKSKISKSLEGHKFSEESKRKMSKSHKGKKLSEETKRKLSKARQNLSVETRRRISEGQKNINAETRLKMNKARSGKNHYNWKGGISFEPYCMKFNDKIKEEIRNGYGRLCLLCGKDEEENGMKLDVHHVDYNKQQGCDGQEWCLVPLCKSCHTKTSMNRKTYGKILNRFVNDMSGGLR